MEESNTANILLCLSVKQDGSNAVPSSSGAGLEGSQSEKNGSQMHSSSSMEDLDSDNYNSGKVLANKGNIIDQLRQKVRVEAASSLKDKSGESEDEYGEMKGHNVSTWQNGQNLATTDKASPGQAENKSSGDLETIK